MTLADTQILSVVQIALIGILVVIGMFLMWRKIQRLEQKMEMFMASCESSQCFASDSAHCARIASPSGTYTPCDGNANDENMELFDEGAEEELMKTLFQEGSGMEDATAAFMVFTPYGFNGSTVSPGVTNHVSTSPASPSSPSVANVKIEEIDTKHEHEDGMSEVPTEKGGITRTKLSRMNVDRLKELSHQHELSTEGTRKQLMDRLIEKLQL
jgi:hypothetical protein